jgi:hypothetical protein
MMKRVLKEKNQITVLPLMKALDTREEYMARALLDMGCDMLAINKHFMEKHRINAIPILRPVRVQNVDRIENTMGKITHYVLLLMKWDTTTWRWTG